MNLAQITCQLNLHIEPARMNIGHDLYLINVNPWNRCQYHVLPYPAHIYVPFLFTMRNIPRIEGRRFAVFGVGRPTTDCQAILRRIVHAHDSLTIRRWSTYAED